MQVSFQYPAVYIILIVAASILLAYWLYNKFGSRNDAAKPLVVFLMSLRSLGLAFIAMLLLVPFIRQIQIYLEKPIIAIGLDNSVSMQLVDSTNIANVQRSVKNIKESLGQDFKVEEFVFGDDVLAANWSLKDKKSNLSEWLKFVGNQYKHSNLAGVVTVSDGIYNSGGNPTYSGYQIMAPHYTIGLGDTTAPIDARIAYVNHNDIAYMGNQFPIKVGVEIEKLKGTSLNLSLKQKGKTLETRMLNVTENTFFKEFSFLANAESVGVQQYELVLTDIEGELSVKNNIQKVFVEVIDADKNILIAYDAPHPDIAAIRKSIERNKNYNVDLWWVNNPDKSNAVSNFDQYHLVVMHNLPKSNSAAIAPVFSASSSLLLVVDNTVNVNQLNRMQDLIRFQLKSTESNNVSAVFNSVFSGYSLNKTKMAQFEDFPPAKGLFADVSFSNSSDVLFYQKIGNVTTGYPLLTISQSSNKKIGVITATGLWRWFLYEYSKNEGFAGIDELFAQTTQYLSLKEDKRRLRLNRSKYLYPENEDVELSVSFFDKNYLPAENASIICQIEAENNQLFEYSFIQKGKLYELNAGELSPGNYTYKITASLGDDRHFLTGKFTVAEINIELMQPVANHNLLYQLAAENNGELLKSNQMNSLVGKLQSSDYAKPIRHEKAEISELIHNKWLFALILLVFTTEWILRKYKGAQ
ncbi:MAG: hypothetical protein ACPGLV_07725 [Bacteroidia bacterium]